MERGWSVPYCSALALGAMRSGTPISTSQCFCTTIRLFWSELQPLGALTTDIMLETNAVISAKPFPADAYQDRTLFMLEVRRDGIAL
jgi:hypothetical protein